MTLNVYSSEKFERSKLRYIIFAIVFIIIIGVSIIYTNIVGTILMFFLLGAYIYYGIIDIRKITLKTGDNGIIVDSKLIPWTELVGFCIEIEKETQNIKNIVLIYPKKYEIHTIVDKIENIQNFVGELSKHIQMLSEYKQTSRERFSRKIKL